MNIKRVLGGCAAGLAVAAGATAQADTRYWLGQDGTGVGKWSVTENWDDGLKPTAADLLSLNSGATYEIDLDVTSTADAPLLGGLYGGTSNTTTFVNSDTSITNVMYLASGVVGSTFKKDSVVTVKGTNTKMMLQGQATFVDGSKIVSEDGTQEWDVAQVKIDKAKFDGTGNGNATFESKGGSMHIAIANASTLTYPAKTLTFNIDGGNIWVKNNAKGVGIKFNNASSTLNVKMNRGYSSQAGVDVTKALVNLDLVDSELKFSSFNATGANGSSIKLNNSVLKTNWGISFGDGYDATALFCGANPCMRLSGGGGKIGAKAVVTLIPELSWDEKIADSAEGKFPLFYGPGTGDNSKVYLNSGWKCIVDVSKFAHFYGTKKIQFAYTASTAERKFYKPTVEVIGEGAENCTVTFDYDAGKAYDKTSSMWMTIVAENPAEDDVAGIVKDGHKVWYKTLAEAFANVDADGTVTLVNNATLDKTMFIDKNVTLDLGAYNVTGNANGLALTEGYATKDTLFCVLYGASLTVKGTGEINYGGNTSVCSAIKLTDANDVREGEEVASLTVEGGTIVGYYYGITGFGGRSGTAVTVNGGTIRGTAANDNAGIYNPQAGTLTVNGGTIEGAVGIYMKAGKVTASVTAGTIVANGEAKTYETQVGSFVATGDALVIDNADYPGGEPMAEIIGGTFVSSNANAVASYAKTGFTPVGGFLEGGTFNTEPAEALIKEGYKVEQVGDMWEVVLDGEPVCKVGDRYFASLQKAYDNVPDDDAIVFVADATVPMLTLDRNIKVYFDLHGYTLTPEEGDTIFTVEAGKVYLWNFPEGETTGALMGGVVVNGGNVQITMPIDADPALTVNGGEVVAINAMDGSVVVNDGYLRLQNYGDYKVAIDAPGVAIQANGGQVNVTGGTFTGGTVAIQADGGKVDVTGGSFTGSTAAFAAGPDYTYRGIDDGTFSHEISAQYLKTNRLMKQVGDTWVIELASDEENVTYTWNGALDGNWADKANWTPSVTRCFGIPSNNFATASFPSLSTKDLYATITVNLGGEYSQLKGIVYNHYGRLALTNGTVKLQAGVMNGDRRIILKDATAKVVDPVFANASGFNYQLSGNATSEGDVSPHTSSTTQVNNLLAMGDNNKVTGTVHNRNAQFNVHVLQDATLDVGEIKADSNTAGRPLSIEVEAGGQLNVDKFEFADTYGRFAFTFHVPADGLASAPVAFQNANAMLTERTALTVKIDKNFAGGRIPLISGTYLSENDIKKIVAGGDYGPLIVKCVDGDTETDFGPGVTYTLEASSEGRVWLMLRKGATIFFVK